MRYHYTYRISHPILNKFYIGVRTSDVKPEIDDYWGSSKFLRALMREHPEGWVKEILSRHRTREAAMRKEAELITYETLLHPSCLNKTRGGATWVGCEKERFAEIASIRSKKCWQREDYREKMSAAIKEVHTRPDVIASKSVKCKAAAIASWQDPEVRARRTQALQEKHKDSEFLKARGKAISTAAAKKKAKGSV